MNKRHFFSLFVVSILVAGVLVNFVSAAGSSPEGEYPIYSAMDLWDFIHGMKWSDFTHLNFWMYFIVYFLAPWFFLYFVIYGFLEDAHIFEASKVNGAIAFALALAAIPTGILSDVVWFISQFAVLGVIIIFFSIFVLYLSHKYRRKAVEYQYVLGSKFLTQLVIHSPILFFSTLAGLELGIFLIGNGKVLSPSAAATPTAIITAIIMGVVGYAIAKSIPKLEESPTAVLIGAGVGVGLAVYVLLLKYFSQNAYFIGSLLGFDFGILWVGLGMIAHRGEATRIKAIMADNGKVVEEYTALRIVRDALAQRTEMSCKDYKKYLEAILEKNKKLLKKYGADHLVDVLKSMKFCQNGKINPSVERVILQLEDMLDLKMKQLEDSMDATTNLLLVGKKEYK